VRINLGHSARHGYAEWELDASEAHAAEAVASMLDTGIEAVDPTDIDALRDRPPASSLLRSVRLPGNRIRLHCWFDPSTVDTQDLLDTATGTPRSVATDPARAGTRQVTDLPAAPDLPVSTRLTPGRSRTWAQDTIVLPASDWTRLREAARQHDATPDAVLLAALTEVLRVWSANDEFTVRIAATGGALLAMPPTGLTVADRVRFARQRLSEIEENRYPGVDQLFPVSMSPLLHASSALRELSVRPTESALHVQLAQENGELRISAGWLEALFPPGMIADLHGALHGLLRRLADEPTAWEANRLDLVPHAHLVGRQLVNATEAAFEDRLLHTPIAEHAASRPDALAVYTPDRTLTYRELSRRVNQVGNVLRGRGVRPNQLVAVVMERGWEQIVAAHGILAAGGAYLPIDPHVPAERLRHLLSQGEVEFVLTQQRLTSTVDWPSGMTLLAVDGDFDGCPADPLEPVQQSTDLAYVIYTSGSTGLPKGVMVEHRGVWNMIVDINRRLGVGPEDRCIAVSAMVFDLSVYDIFGMIAAGGCVVMPAPSPTPDTAHWARIIADAGVTFWNSAPQLLEMLLLHLESTGDAAAIASLRTVILAGDWMPLTLPDRLRALNPGITLYNAGGPAETCVWSICYPVGDVDPEWVSMPYGRPISNQRYHVLDKQLHHRPAWVPGELHVTSEVGLAKGYWRDDVRTKERFLTLPGTGEPAYATGDVGRYLPDGTIELLGRTDLQVKIQGVRIELGEVEAVLTQYPGVRTAVVVACGKDKQLTTLRAFVVTEAADPGQDWLDQLREFLAQRLPQYMVPGLFTVLDELPLSANGKVDRKRLAEHAEPVRERTGVAPRTEVERSLATLWSETLDGIEVFAHDNFFALGGHSLRAVALLYRVNDTFGVELPLHEFMENPILEAVAELISLALSDGDDALLIVDEVASLSDDEVLALLADH
jgi:amino acid adenylation domain-containing protein